MRTIVFFDGQNLYHLARNAWAPEPQVPGSPYGYPSYDVEKIAALMAGRHPGRILQQVRFYTGVPEPRSPQTTFWHGFWGNKQTSSATSGARESTFIAGESIRAARKRA